MTVMVIVVGEVVAVLVGEEVVVVVVWGSVGRMNIYDLHREFATQFESCSEGELKENESKG